MNQTKLLFLLITALAFASCGSDEEEYDVNNLAGTWARV